VILSMAMYMEGEQYVVGAALGVQRNHGTLLGDLFDEEPALEDGSAEMT
jgi:hypothetical protein